MRKANFRIDQGSSEDWYVLEETKLNGIDYILVTDSEPDEDGEAIILMETGTATDGDTLYEVVTDDVVLDALALLFNSLLDDTALCNIP